MKDMTFITAASLLALSACAGRSEARPGGASVADRVAAARIVEATPSIEEAAVTSPAPRALPTEPIEPEPPSRAKREEGRPVARVDAANRAAVREPSRQSYINGAQVYAWSEGALYRLYTAPERVSEIALQPGETLISAATGDTVRWVIGDTTSGAGPSARTHILVKPTSAGLRTNLVLTTDRRVYHVQLESVSRSFMASMSWTYPADELIALSRRNAAAPVAAGIAVEALNFGYRIEGDDPAWRPLRAFDDGRQVFIEFPASIATGEAPPLFVVGAKGAAELVNYRVRGRYYVVDRLFDAAELRLGQKRQQVVRIRRSDASGGRRRGRL